MSTLYNGVEIQWREHKTSSSIIAAYLRYAGKRFEKRELAAIGVESRRELKLSVDDYGAWGFCWRSKRAFAVHYWLSSGVKMHRAALVLGHELGHIFGASKGQLLANETVADSYGQVARAVVERLKKIVGQDE